MVPLTHILGWRGEINPGSGGDRPLPTSMAQVFLGSERAQLAPSIGSASSSTSGLVPQVAHVSLALAERGSCLRLCPTHIVEVLPEHPNIRMLGLCQFLGIESRFNWLLLQRTDQLIKKLNPERFISCFFYCPPCSPMWGRWRFATVPPPRFYGFLENPISFCPTKICTK